MAYAPRLPRSCSWSNVPPNKKPRKEKKGDTYEVVEVEIVEDDFQNNIDETQKELLVKKVDELESILTRANSDMQKMNNDHGVEVNELKKRLAAAESEIAVLKKDLKTSKAKETNLEQRVKELEEELHRSEVKIALLNLGQVSTEIQVAIYKCVFPDRPVNPKFPWNYKMQRLLRKVEDSREAKRRFEALKQSLNWNDALRNAMNCLSEYRNDEAHPPANEASVQGYVKVLDGNKYFTGDPSLADVNRLVDIWTEFKQKGLI